jgi:hypothetical protein
MHAQRGESAFRSSEQISFSSRPFYSDALPDTDSALPVTCSSLQFDFMVLPNLCVFRDGGFRDGGAIAAVAAFSRGRRKNKLKKNRRGKESAAVLWPAGASEGHLPPGRLAKSFHQTGVQSMRFATLEPGNYRPLAPHIAS